MQLFGQIFYYLTLAILGLESLTYSGFFEKHTHISVWYLLVIVGLLSKIVPWKKVNKQIKDWHLCVIFGGWLMFILMESIFYPNFVFSRFHINLESTSLFIGLLLWPRAVGYLSKQSFFIVISCFLSILYIVPALQKTLISGLTKNKSEISHLNKTYDEKMAEEYGPSYYYYKFVAENTSNTAKIIVPPQIAPWIRTGNVGLSKYFLGTRRLMNGGIDSLPNLENVDYIMISSETVNSGSPYRLWPEFDVTSKEVLVFDIQTKSVTQQPSFDPKYFSQNRFWGLIKITK